MQAIVLDATGTAHYQNNVSHPTPQPDEAVVRVTLAGICGTDIELTKGYKGFSGILGHEFVGVVEQSPNPDWIGQRVVSSINIGCQVCFTCQTQGANHCAKRRVIGILDKDGAFADYISVPMRNLFAVPENVDDETAVFTEPLAAAQHVLEAIPLDLGASIAIVGPGRLGLLIGLVLQHAGFAVMMLGRSTRSLQLPQQLGLETGYTQEIPDNHFSTVVEATGNSAGLTESLRITQPKGTILLKSTFAKTPTLGLNKIVVSELTVIGSRCGRFAPALRLLAQGVLPVKALINGRYPLNQWQTAIEHASQSGVRKILLTP